MKFMVRGFSLAILGVLACACLAAPQRPSDLDAGYAIEKSRAIALDYTRSLPDFVCSEVVRRFADPRHRDAWVPTDTLTIRLSYFEQKEQHKLNLIDGKVTDRSYESLEGGVSVGEFGATLRTIFDPASAAHFQWQSWKNVRKRRAAVYSYVVEPSRSRYVLINRVAEGMVQAVVGFHGVVELDRETGEVLHFTYDADNIPKKVGIEYAASTVDYDFAGVGGRKYLLPASAVMVLHSPSVWVRNDVEFREYRKFSSDSTIDFGADK
jgi:hypothetical protein